MATEFVAFQPPPGDVLKDYDRSLPSDQQPSTIYTTFKEAMSVREAVFVEQQGVPLEKELDDDDARSFHWVVYASVGNTASPTTLTPKKITEDGDAQRRKSESTATRVPVGTIRLVPPPHAPHPLLGAGSEHRRVSITVDGDNSTRSDSPHPPSHSEPFVKLGRLAILPPYRGLGLSRLLISTALTWSRAHSSSILPPLAPTDIEAAKLDGGREDFIPWRGLVLVDAQRELQGLWEGAGFTRDEGMGEWVEEGIEHLGLWRRVDVAGLGGKVPLC
jgi:predicted GNAT family N-acyltransferase